MRFEAVRVLLSLVASVALFVLSLPIVLFAFLVFAFSILAVGGVSLLEYLRQTIPGVDPEHILIDGMPPFVQVILAGISLIVAAGLFVAPPVIMILLVARSYRVVCYASLGALALLVIGAAVLFPHLGADFFLNGRKTGEIVFYFSASGVLYALLAAAAFHGLLRSLSGAKPVEARAAVL
jgi:hypothetical protein